MLWRLGLEKKNKQLKGRFDLEFCFWNFISSQTSCELQKEASVILTRGLMKRGRGKRNELRGDAMERATRTAFVWSKGLRCLEKKKSLKRPKQDSQFQPELRIKFVQSDAMGTVLYCSQINQEQLMEKWYCGKRTKARLTQFSYHMNVGSTFFVLTEWNQRRQFTRLS